MLDPRDSPLKAAWDRNMSGWPKDGAACGCIAARGDEVAMAEGRKAAGPDTRSKSGQGA